MKLESDLAIPTLTQKQQAVFDFIQRYISEYRQSPLIREIQLGCEIASYKSAVDRLNALEHKGYIRRVPNKHRGIRLFKRHLQPASAVPTPSLEGAGEGVPA